MDSTSGLGWRQDILICSKGQLALVDVTLTKSDFGKETGYFSFQSNVEGSSSRNQGRTLLAWLVLALLRLAAQGMVSPTNGLGSLASLDSQDTSPQTRPQSDLGNSSLGIPFQALGCSRVTVQVNWDSSLKI